MEMQGSLKIKKDGTREGKKTHKCQKKKYKSIPTRIPPKLLSQCVDDTSEKTAGL